MRVAVLIVRIVSVPIWKTGPGQTSGTCIGWQWGRKACFLLINDVYRTAIRKRTDATVRARVRGSGERRGVGPNKRFQVVLRILAASRDGVPIKTVSCTQHRFWMDLPGNSKSWSPVILDWRRSKKSLPSDHQAGSMGIGQKFVRNAWSLLRLAAQCGHSFRAHDIELSL